MVPNRLREFIVVDEVRIVSREGLHAADLDSIFKGQPDHVRTHEHNFRVRAHVRRGVRIVRISRRFRRHTAVSLDGHGGDIQFHVRRNLRARLAGRPAPAVFGLRRPRICQYDDPSAAWSPQAGGDLAPAQLAVNVHLHSLHARIGSLGGLGLR
jgi:hypothetical protein